MSGTGIAIGFISLGILVLSNVIIVAFSYGRISQCVNDLCRRVERIENKVWNEDN